MTLERIQEIVDLMYQTSLKYAKDNGIEIMDPEKAGLRKKELVNEIQSLSDQEKKGLDRVAKKMAAALELDRSSA